MRDRSGGRTVVDRSITAPGIYSGALISRFRTRQWQRVQAACASLPELVATRASAGAGRRRRDAANAPGHRREEAMSAADDGRMDIDEIMRYLPHRYPVSAGRSRHVDRGGQVDPRHQERDDERALFHRAFPAFSGDAGRARDRGARAARIDSAWKIAGRTPGDGTLIFFAGIDDARFRRQVRPGDQLRARVGGAAHGARRRQIRRARQSTAKSSRRPNLMAAMRMPRHRAKR